jgi:hypothetical protein
VRITHGIAGICGLTHEKHKHGLHPRFAGEIALMRWIKGNSMNRFDRKLTRFSAIPILPGSICGNVRFPLKNRINLWRCQHA